MKAHYFSTKFLVQVCAVALFLGITASATLASEAEMKLSCKVVFQPEEDIVATTDTVGSRDLFSFTPEVQISPFYGDLGEYANDPKVVARIEGDFSYHITAPRDLTSTWKDNRVMFRIGWQPMEENAQIYVSHHAVPRNLGIDDFDLPKFEKTDVTALLPMDGSRAYRLSLPTFFATSSTEYWLGYQILHCQF